MGFDPQTYHRNDDRGDLSDADISIAEFHEFVKLNCDFKTPLAENKKHLLKLTGISVQHTLSKVITPILF